MCSDHGRGFCRLVRSYESGFDFVFGCDGCSSEFVSGWMWWHDCCCKELRPIAVVAERDIGRGCDSRSGIGRSCSGRSSHTWWSQSAVHAKII